MSDATGIKPLVVSAPFGNYVQPAGATATLGTFTAARRPGRLMQIIKTVRRYGRIGAWVNKIGLRNPGIDWLVERVESGKIDVSDKLVSIHGFSDDDWKVLLDKIGRIKPMGVELNMSCPNVGEIDLHVGLFESALASGAGCVVVKVPPVNYAELFAQAYQEGVRIYHCCNTLPVPAGGMSGKPLKPVSLQCIGQIRKDLGEEKFSELTIIGGGGVREPKDIDDYASVGAKHVAIGTRVMNPIFLTTVGPLRPLIDRANSLFEASGEAG
jgi:dihydroorotate dehydrogenase